MRPNIISFIVIAIFLLPTLASANVSFLKKTESLSGEFVIATISTSDGGEDYCFFNRQTNKSMGALLTQDETDGMSNIMLLASWNADSSKVAVLVSYGRRMQSLRIFERSHDNFKPVGFVAPDLIKIFKNYESSHLLSENLTGGSRDALGPWTSINTVELIVGEELDLSDGSTVNFLVRFTATVKKGQAHLSDFELLPSLNQESARKYFSDLNNWIIP